MSIVVATNAAQLKMSHGKIGPTSLLEFKGNLICKGIIRPYSITKITDVIPDSLSNPAALSNCSPLYSDYVIRRALRLVQSRCSSDYDKNI